MRHQSAGAENRQVTKKTRKKPMFITGLIGASIMAFSIFGHKVVHTEIVIPAPPAAVWSVLTDAPRYKDWNPVFVNVEGEYREGAKLTNRVQEPSGKVSVIVSTAVRMVDQRELNQFGGIRGILTFDHKWLLEPIDSGTRVTQHEEYRGIGVWFWDASWIEPAYSRANEALRDRVLRGLPAPLPS